jgi:hypothetical protein
VTRHALSTLLALLCAALLAACGDAEDAPDAAAASTLAQTVAATSKLENAKLSATFRFEPDGPAALAGPIVARASGPVAAPAAAGGLPRFDLALAATLGGMPLQANVLSTGKRGYLQLGGTSYRVDDELVDELGKALAGANGGFASLGLDPASWISKPRSLGTARVGDAETQRIAGDIDVRRLLADVARLLDGMGGGDLLTPKLREQIAGAVRSARAEVWTGVEDRIMRQLTVAVDFALDKDAGRPMGIEGGRVNLRLRLDGVNRTPVKVTPPKGAKPLSSLFAASGLGGLLHGLGPGAKGGAGIGGEGEAFLKCLESAGGDSSAVTRCASKLAKP